MAEPVLLISSDPFLGASLEAVARGRLQVARLDPSRRPLAWPGGPPGTVVLDVTARHGGADRGYAQAVLEATAGRLLGGRDLLAAGRALGEAGASGHLRAYAADPAVARLLARQHLDGAADQRG